MKPLKFISSKELHDSREYLELTLPRGSVAFIFSVTAILLIALLWAIFGEIDIVAKAEVLLRPRVNISILKNEMTGTAVEKTYHQGKPVRKGELLWRLDTKNLDFEYTKTNIQLNLILDRQRQWESLQEAYASGSISQLKVGTEAFAKAAVYFGMIKRLKMESDQAERVWKKELALPSSVSLPDRQKELEFNAKMANIAVENYAKQSELEVVQTIFSIRQDRDAIEKRLAAIEQQLRAAQVVAPIDGNIQEIVQFNQGDILVIGDPIARIVPDGASDLRVELKVSNLAIAEIKPGMIYHIRFSSLPPSDYGQVQGIITEVPADAQISSSTTPFFILQGDLSKTSLSNHNGEVVNLRSGMIGEGRIILKHKTIMRYLLEKLDFLW